jgi:hypothetical protein
MKRLIFLAIYFGLLSFLGGAIAERHGYLDWLTAPKVEPMTPRLVPYYAVLVAGDASIPNFDNAVESLTKRLMATKGKTSILTSDASLLDDWHGYATAWMIEDALRGVGESDGCLVFATSHGDETGLVMGLDNAEHFYLTPARLADILERECGQRPTVAILSGCHTGTFLTEPMMTENRIILTAARHDRTSFGCSTDTTYTYFDECLLDALEVAVAWTDIFDRTKSCVTEQERKQDVEPADPQAFFGAAVADLGIE